MTSLRILPLHLRHAALLPLPGRGYRLLLPLAAPFPRNEDIGTLSFHLNHLGDYNASLRLWHLLRSHVRRCFVVFGEPADDSSKGPTCRCSFGLRLPEKPPSREHPLALERAFFHFPQQDLFLNVEVPRPPRNWQEFTLCFDLDASWPRAMTVNESMFQLFAVPVTNQVQGLANPISCDGTTWRHAIRHPNTAGRFALHEVIGVHRIDNGVMTPLVPGILSGSHGAYEVETVPLDDGSSGAYVDIHLPQAFDEPCTASLDATWYQPWFSECLGEPQAISPFRRLIDGVTWDLAASIKGHDDSRFDEEMDAYLHLFTLRGKKHLNGDDVIALLNALGTVWKGHFRPIRRLLGPMTVEEVQVGRRGTGTVKYVYSWEMKEFEPILEPLVNAFLSRVARILDVWIPGGPVELRARSSGSIPFEWRSSS